MQKIEQSKRNLDNFTNFNSGEDKFRKSKDTNKIEFEEIIEENEIDKYEDLNDLNYNKDKKEIILLRAVKNKKNSYVFQLLPEKIEFTRKLKDIYWLQNSLKVEFPYYYVY